MSELWISWSSLRTHMECKQKSHLKRGKKSAPLQNTRMFFAGTVTDRVVRDWLKDPEREPGTMADMVHDTIDREKKLIDEGDRGVMLWKDSKDRADVEAACIEAVQKIEPALLKYVTPFEVMADYRFTAPMDLPHPGGGTERVVLNGYMDILVRDLKGRYWIWDVKHTRDDGYWRKTAGQIGFYDLAAFAMFGQYSIRGGLLQPLCKEPVKLIPQTDEARTKLLQSVSSMAWDVWSGDKQPRKDSSLCGFCEVKHACSKFEPIPTSNGKRRVAF